MWLVLALGIEFVAAGTPVDMLVPEDMNARGRARISGQTESSIGM
jgi:hypothetical protein